jgi:hypothetical protein
MSQRFNAARMEAVKRARLAPHCSASTDAIGAASWEMRIR